MNARQLQALYARRREQEHQRTERTQAVSQYYDHFGKINTRFQNWTGPEYYKKNDEKISSLREQKAKEKLTNERREKLQARYAEEQKNYELELKQRERAASQSLVRLRHADTKMLQQISEDAKEQAELKHRLDMEAKLYGRLRHGVDDDKLLFESKTNNETLAKLSWLDKQVDNQMAREQEAAAAEERRLRLQQEIAKTEQASKEREALRESQIRELRELQESYMQQIKQNEQQVDSLKADEDRLRSQMELLQKEQDLLVDSSALPIKNSEQPQNYNGKNIKAHIRKRSENFRDHMRTLIGILERIKKWGGANTQIDDLIEKYRLQCETENAFLDKVESMYESEAKNCLTKCEELWQAQHLKRYEDMMQFLQCELDAITAALDNVRKRQRELTELSQKYVENMERCNEGYKELKKEGETTATKQNSYIDDYDLQKPIAAPKILPKSIQPTSQAAAGMSSANLNGHVCKRGSALARVTDSFSNLNLHGYEESLKAAQSAPSQAERQAVDILPSSNVQPSNSAQQFVSSSRPQFARKRAAWN